MEEAVSEVDSLLDTLPSTRSLGVMGVSFKTSPIEVREALSKQITVERIAEMVRNDESLSNSELVLLSTCNRTEIYYFGDKLCVKSLRRMLLPLASENYQFRAEKAVSHLFEVAAGLDSMVVGESQILGQVREASKLSSEHKLSGEVLSRLFSKAYESAKSVREMNPEFAAKTYNSVNAVVFDVIRKNYANKKPNIMLVGSGKMIRLALGSMDKSQFGNIYIASRKKNVEGADSGSAVDISEVSSIIANHEIDVVITATTAPEYILNKDEVRGAKRSLLVIDISVPRNVNPNLRELANIMLLDLDDLKEEIAKQPDETASHRVRGDLSKGVEEFNSWLSDYEVIAPILSTLRKNAETIRDQELKRAFSRMPHLTEKERAIMDKMTERIIRRFLHEPTERIKKISRTEGNRKAKIYAEAISELFASSTTDGNE